MKHNHIQDYDKQYKEFKATWEPFDLAFGSGFEQGGFYVQEIIPKLRTINTNTLAFTKKNKLISDCDVSGSPGRNQLDWLKKSLDDTRIDGSKAYIL